MLAPGDLQQLFQKHKKAAGFFDNLAFTHKREYVEWILTAKRDDTRQQRLQTVVAQLNAGKKTYNEK